MEVPFTVSLRAAARGLGVPPWSLVHPDRPPTEAEVGRWYALERICQSMGI